MFVNINGLKPFASDKTKTYFTDNRFVRFFIKDTQRKVTIDFKQ